MSGLPRSSAPPARRVRVLKVPIDAWQIGGLITQSLLWAKARELRTIMYANVHVVNTAWSNKELSLALEQADTVYCDGSGVRLGARLLGHGLPPRMTAADWIDDFCDAAAAQGINLFILAGRDGVASLAAQILADRHPGLTIVGTHHGYVNTPGASDSAIAAIEASQPHVVFVGMGTPLQETWVARNRHVLGARVVWCVGALFDFVAGEQLRGPSWLVRNHMEWAARLASDPRRLWKRYLIGNPVFLTRVVLQRLVGS